MVHLFIDLVLMDLSLDLYLSIGRVSMKKTDPTSRNLRRSERNNGDITKFHESASTSHSETDIGNSRDAYIKDEHNARDASTTDAPPRYYHAYDASVSETIPRRSKRLS